MVNPREILGITKAKMALPRMVRMLERGALEKVVLVRQNAPVAVVVSVATFERLVVGRMFRDALSEKFGLYEDSASSPEPEEQS